MNVINTLELERKHPHLFLKIQNMWGSAECRSFLMRLINDSRNGTRQGFDYSVANILLKLLNRHDRVFPQFNIIDETHIHGFVCSKKQYDQKLENDWFVVKTLTKILGVSILIGLAHEIFKGLY